MRQNKICKVIIIKDKIADKLVGNDFNPNLLLQLILNINKQYKAIFVKIALQLTRFSNLEIFDKFKTFQYIKKSATNQL